MGERRVVSVVHRRVYCRFFILGGKDMRTNKYKEFFTKEFLMGPNSIRLLDELLEKAPEKIAGVYSTLAVVWE